MVKRRMSASRVRGCSPPKIAYIGSSSMSSQVSPSGQSVALLSLGCARNLVDSEVALGGLVESGYQVISDVKQADIAIVNTCGFIGEAKEESIQAILQLAELKKQNKIQKLVVMGCLSQRYGQDILQEIKEIDILLGTDQFKELGQILATSSPAITGAPLMRVQPRPRFLLDQFTPLKSLTPQHYTYIKISEGCINACSYCAIPSMKGKHRSRPIADVLAEAMQKAASGLLREINLIGQDTAAYGYDLERRFMLHELLAELAKALPQVWIRVLYAHPAHVTPPLVEVFSRYSNLCPYIDIPIEHSHPDMLRRMNRGVTREYMDQVIRDFRKLPHVILRTAIIVGFPGETEEEFENLLRYMEEVRFERLGAFVYSHEENTRSFDMPNQISEEVKRERFGRVMELQESLTSEWNQTRVGQKLSVLIEEYDPQSKVYLGRSQYDAPEVDGHVILQRPAKDLVLGEFVQVKVVDALTHDVVGELAS